MTDSTPHGTTAVRAATPARQPFHYPLTRPFVEPDWRRIPGFRDVTQAEWESALWQRKHTLKNLKELKAALGPLLPDALAASIERDQKERATMSLLVPPQMLNTMRHGGALLLVALEDRKSTRLNSSHDQISHAVF